MRVVVEGRVHFGQPFCAHVAANRKIAPTPVQKHERRFRRKAATLVRVITGAAARFLLVVVAPLESLKNCNDTSLTFRWMGFDSTFTSYRDDSFTSDIVMTWKRKDGTFWGINCINLFTSFPSFSRLLYNCYVYCTFRVVNSRGYRNVRSMLRYAQRRNDSSILYA